MMEAAPHSTFEMIEADLLLQFLIVALDTPTQTSSANQRLERCIRRQRREIELRRRFLAVGPLAEQPLFVAWWPPLGAALGGTNSSRDEARRLFAARALAPGDASVIVEAKVGRIALNRDGIDVSSCARRRTTSFAVGARHDDGVDARLPDAVAAHDTDDVGQLSLRQAVAEFGRIAVASIGEDDVPAHAGCEGVVDEGERDLPLLRELDLDGNADRPSTRAIACPRFGQKQAHPDACTAELAGQMNADRD